ncbi:MAG: LPXTG cell wall anchor domain-containing protein [Clostridia bacterium]|nr:LPXTG cell wall anchor domain-containing protein [Clostridia bacterium]
MENEFLVYLSIDKKLSWSTYENFSTVDTVLDKVVDTMGDNIEFIEVVAGDYDTTPICTDDVLTWYPRTAEMTAGEGSGSEWQENAAQLVYRVRLNNTTSCAKHLDLDTGCTAQCDHVYPVNQSAKLEYHFSDNTDYYTAEFPVPYVRGLLYDIHFTKVDADHPEQVLSGAEFTLTGNGSTYTCTSDEYGEVSFTDLPWGTYTLQKTAAPENYEITFEGKEITLCYTTDRQCLMVDDDHPANLMYYAGEGGWQITNRLAAIDVTIEKVDQNDNPLEGASFMLQKLSDDNTWEDIEVEIVPVIPEEGSSAVYVIEDLLRGTYCLTETQAPAGYLLMTETFIFVVEGGSITTEGTYKDVKVEENTITIINRTGYVLPSTGGIGTFLYTFGGLMIVGASGILFMYKSRRRLKE